MAREPRTVARIRKAPTPTEAILLQHIDALTDALDRFGNLDLTEEQIMQVVGPATDSIGDKDVWMLGQRDLTRWPAPLLTAAVRDRAGK